MLLIGEWWLLEVEEEEEQGRGSIRVFFSSASPLVLIARCKSEMAVLHDSVRGNRGVNG